MENTERGLGLADHLLPLIRETQIKFISREGNPGNTETLGRSPLSQEDQRTSKNARDSIDERGKAAVSGTLDEEEKECACVLRNGKPPSILIVEDNTFNIFTLRLVL
jgi:hypothetical protein